MSAFNKIAAGLREALAVARGEAKPAKLHVYSGCDRCGNVTKTIDGRCELCHERKRQGSGA